MFRPNRINNQTLLGRPLGVSRNVEMNAIEEGAQFTYESPEKAQALLQVLTDQRVPARATGTSVVIPWDSIEGEGFSEAT